jgi:hypothetical protein
MIPIDAADAAGALATGEDGVAAEAAGAGAGGGAGVGGGAGARTGGGSGLGPAGAAGCAGKNRSGSRYPFGSSMRRMPRWTYGTSCSTSPLGPIVPTADASATVSPRRALVEPRWVSVTEYPSGVWIVSVLPLTGTVPTNETVPDAGASTVAPDGAPMSIPLCWPAAYGSSPKTNFCRTGPWTGQFHASADGAITRAAANTAIRVRRIFLLVVLFANRATIPMASVVVNSDYSEAS